MGDERKAEACDEDEEAQVEEEEEARTPVGLSEGQQVV